MKHRSVSKLIQIDALLSQYEVFLIDAWGVLHDGHSLYPGAKETLELLRLSGKKCIVISNAIRRHDTFIAQLTELGLQEQLYDSVVTSGELCWQAFFEGNKPELERLGVGREKRCYHLSTSASQDYIDTFCIEQADQVEDAQFILNTVAGGGYQVDDFLPTLKRANKLGLPMVCPNPDLVAIKNGIPIITAGALAKAYENFGGRVCYFGKPHQAIYEHCFNQYTNIQRSSFIALGDGLPTDIKGANRAEIDSILLASGIHHELLNSQTLEAAVQQFEATPTYLLTSLQRNERY